MLVIAMIRQPKKILKMAMIKKTRYDYDEDLVMINNIIIFIKVCSDLETLAILEK